MVAPTWRQKEAVEWAIKLATSHTNRMTRPYASAFMIGQEDANMEALADVLAGLDVAADPVGSVEIAAKAGVSRSTVDQWRQRGLGFPAPRWIVGGRPAWDWPDVAAWLAATGRMV